MLLDSLLGSTDLEIPPVRRIEVVTFTDQI